MWNPPIVKTVATENKDIEELAAAIENYRLFQKREGANSMRKRDIARWRLMEILQERLLGDLLKKNGTKEKVDRLASEIAEKKSDPYSAVEELLRR